MARGDTAAHKSAVRAHLAATDPATGLWLDTSNQSPDDTVVEIVARRREALVVP